MVGGWVRHAHEGNEKLSIQTDIVSMEPGIIVVKVTVETEKGRYGGTGTSSAQRDTRLADSLVELAETRAIARASRFGVLGVEYCAAEKVNHVVDDSDRVQSSGKEARPVSKENNGGGKPGSKSQSCGIGRATQVQCRAFYALTRRADYSEEDIDRMLSHLNAATFQELTREAASQLIIHLQTEAPPYSCSW